MRAQVAGENRNTRAAVRGGPSMPTTGPQNWPENDKNWRRGFWSLIATQFQGAFNDNGLKFFVIYLILGQNPTTAQKDFGVFLIGNLFAIPFLLFSMTGGFLADRLSKRSVTIGTKLFEIFAFQQGNPYLAYTVIFLASTQAALFGPSKYGLLPELLPPELLSWGNGVLELTTFVAIISGTVAVSFLAQQFQGSPATAGMIYGACSLLRLGASFLITRVPASDPRKKIRLNIFGDLGAQWRLVYPDRALKLAIIGNTYFWFLGGRLIFKIIFYGREIMHLNETRG